MSGGFIMKRWLLGCIAGIAALGIVHADDLGPATGYAPFQSAMVTYKNGVTKTLRCNTIGVHFSHFTLHEDENVMICGEMKGIPHLLFTKAAWLVVDSLYAKRDGSLVTQKYFGRDCAVFDTGNNTSAWRCRRWQKLKNVSRVIISGKRLPFPDNDRITYYKVKLPKR
jgi:hypothetical protein